MFHPGTLITPSIHATIPFRALGLMEKLRAYPRCVIQGDSRGLLSLVLVDRQNLGGSGTTSAQDLALS